MIIRLLGSLEDICHHNIILQTRCLSSFIHACRGGFMIHFWRFQPSTYPLLQEICLSVPPRRSRYCVLINVLRLTRKFENECLLSKNHKTNIVLIANVQANQANKQTTNQPTNQPTNLKISQEWGTQKAKDIPQVERPILHPEKSNWRLLRVEHGSKTL